MLENVSMTLKTGEIVALLGRSGSGKSTLLRLISGLTRPTSGKVSISGKPVNGPAEEVAMVFQSFALFPWLNVLDNVEIGPRANGVPLEETRQRALKAIDTIGLDGFESARLLEFLRARRTTADGCREGERGAEPADREAGARRQEQRGVA